MPRCGFSTRNKLSIHASFRTKYRRAVVDSCLPVSETELWRDGLRGAVLGNVVFSTASPCSCGIGRDSGAWRFPSRHKHAAGARIPGEQSVPIHASPSLAVLRFALGVSLITGVLFR